MKIVSYQHQSIHRSGLLMEGEVFDIHSNAKDIGIDLPTTVLELLKLEEEGMNQLKKVKEAISNKKTEIKIRDPKLLAPLPNPTSCRDAYAFRQHVETARRNRGVEMIPEFDEFPIFYFTNHNAIFGGGEILVEEDHLHQLDFELEIAIVIGKQGKNIDSKNADQYIAGFTIMNDLSARKLQMEEMKMNLGPAKGKDFATSIGPVLVTPEELEHKKIETEFGATYDLSMTAFHNGNNVSNGNVKDMNWTFSEIIERVSYGVEIFPGDIIGSGTVGTGCYLELNGSANIAAKEKGNIFEPIWLKESDTIELGIEGLGKLKNTIARSNQNHSILTKKKRAK
ncbi:MAG: fumarylacetoacetate hydrolase family protein [Reichenbachiella sp.]